jgi:putative DNA primase/helicase
MHEGIDMLSAALAWHDAGCAVIPVRADGSKAPLVAWRQYQQRRADRERVTAWFSTGAPGIAVVCGMASGGLEMLELEGRAVEEGFGAKLVQLVNAAGLGEVWQRVAVSGYAERTPSSGIHLLYRVEGGPVERNVKLARRPATEGELAEDPTDKIKTLAETRGEGGYTIVAPSHGTVHDTGASWVALRESTPARIPRITVAERDALVSVVRCMDTVPPPPARTPRVATQPTTSTATTPGDDYEARTDWRAILEPAGWVLVYASGRTRYWRRPGKRSGVSATTGRADDRDRLYVFSSSTEFDAETALTKFHVYAVLHHRGDHAAAARALRGAGFGSRAAPPVSLPAPGDPSPASAGPQQGPSRSPSRSQDRDDEASAQVVHEPSRSVAAWGPTEDGLAMALVAHHGHELRFCPDRGKWLLWTGYRWVWDDAERHRELIRGLARQLPQTGRWRRFRGQALSASGVSGVARLARSDPAVTVSLTDLDARPYELNTPGGVVDLRTGQLRVSDPYGLHTRSTSVAPDIERPPERFGRFLQDTFGDDHDLAGYVQRLMGVSAIGSVLEQILPFAHGPGANGKSTLMEAVMHALGRGEDGYAIAAPSEMLMVRKHAEHPAELAQLSGARLVVCSELDDGQRFAEAKVKQLTGRDSINARFMRRDPFTFAPSHTLWLLGNYMPSARAGGPAFWRRVRLLPFTRVIASDKQNRRLGEELAHEAPAVLAWIVRGAADYRRGGMREPEAVTSATAAYAREEDTIGQFVDEQCRLVSGSASARVATTVLRLAYEQWCEELGEVPVSAKRLTQQLRDRFGVTDTRGTKGRRFYAGVTLLSADRVQPRPTGAARP